MEDLANISNPNGYSQLHTDSHKSTRPHHLSTVSSVEDIYATIVGASDCFSTTLECRTNDGNGWHVQSEGTVYAD